MLYNSHLETLIKVVETGSFRRASEQIGISPSAVLKQIDLLEKDLGVAVFDRSRKGVSLTSAGESVYNDARYIIQYCSDAEIRAREIQEQAENVIRVGISPMTPLDRLIELWPEIQRRCPDMQIRLTHFDNTDLGVDRALHTLGMDSDIVLGLYDENYLRSYNIDALKLADVPFVFAAAFNFSTEDITDEKGFLRLDALEGRTVLFPRRGFSADADAIRNRLMSDYPGIIIKEFNFYSLDTFYSIQGTDQLIITHDIWKTGHILLKILPVSWEYTASYGILHAMHPSAKVVKLLRAVEEQTEGCRRTGALLKKSN